MKLYKINELLLTKTPIGRVSLDSHEEIQRIYPGKYKVYDYPVRKNKYGKGIIPKSLDTCSNFYDFEYLIVGKKYEPKPNGNYFTVKNADVFTGYSSRLWNLIAIVQAGKNCEIFDTDNSSIKIEEGLYFSFIINKEPIKTSKMF